MRNTSRHRTYSSQAQFEARFKSSSRALVVVDERPIRRGLLQELKKLQKSLFKVRKEIEHHETVVRASFHRWYFGRFGERISLVERLRAEFQEKLALLQRMSSLYTYGYTRKKAFDQAKEEVEAMKQDDFFNGDDEDDEEDDEEEEAYDEEFDGFAGRSRANEEFEPYSKVRHTRRVTDEAETRAKEIKLYYRKLVQALHPDRRTSQSEVARQLWHETQSAYKAGDLEQLKLIWTECIVGADPSSDELLLSDITAALTRLREKIKRAQEERRELSKNDPTWNFHKKNKEILASEILSELYDAESEISLAIKGLDREIRSFSGSPHKRERAGRRRPGRDEETDEDQSSFSY